jgi:hypothetical protein
MKLKPAYAKQVIPRAEIGSSDFDDKLWRVDVQDAH